MNLIKLKACLKFFDWKLGETFRADKIGDNLEAIYFKSGGDEYKEYHN
jgi:hypothetical protein